MAVYRITNGIPELFAENNIIQRIASGREAMKVIKDDEDITVKDVVLNGENLAWKQGVDFREPNHYDHTINSHFELDRDNREFIEKDKDGNIVNFNENTYSIFDKFKIGDKKFNLFDVLIRDEYLYQKDKHEDQVDDIETNIDPVVKITGSQAKKFLEIDAGTQGKVEDNRTHYFDAGIRSNLELRFDTDTGDLQMVQRKHPLENESLEVVASVNLELEALLDYVGVHQVVENKWHPALPEEAQSPGFPDKEDIEGKYFLIFTFKQRDGKYDYDFAEVEDVIEEFHPGAGLRLEHHENKKEHTFHVVPNTSKGLQIQEDDRTLEMKLAKVFDSTLNAQANSNIVLHKKDAASEDNFKVRFLAPFSKNIDGSDLNPNLDEGSIFCYRDSEIYSSIKMLEHGYRNFYSYNGFEPDAEPASKYYVLTEDEKKITYDHTGSFLVSALKFKASAKDNTLLNEYTRAYLRVGLAEDAEDVYDIGTIFENGLVERIHVHGVNYDTEECISEGPDGMMGIAVTDANNRGTLFEETPGFLENSIATIIAKILPNSYTELKVKCEWWNVVERHGEWNTEGAYRLLESEDIFIKVNAATDAE